MPIFNRTNRALRAENAHLKAALARTEIRGGRVVSCGGAEGFYKALADKHGRAAKRAARALENTRAELAEARAELARRDRADAATTAVLQAAGETIRHQTAALDAARVMGDMEAALRGALTAENDTMAERTAAEAELNRRLLTAWHRLAGLSAKARAHSVKIGPHYTPNFTKLEKADAERA